MSTAARQLLTARIISPSAYGLLASWVIYFIPSSSAPALTGPDPSLRPQNGSRSPHLDHLACPPRNKRAWSRARAPPVPPPGARLSLPELLHGEKEEKGWGRGEHSSIRWRWYCGRRVRGWNHPPPLAVALWASDRALRGEKAAPYVWWLGRRRT